MAFTTALFLFAFFPLCIGGYHLLRLLEQKMRPVQKLRLKDWYLVLFSLLFYFMAGLTDTLYLCVYVLVVFALGKWVEKRRSPAPPAISLILLLAVLYYCKYFNFIGDVLNQLSGREWIPASSLIAPLGVSFITFSAISYVMDIRRGDAQSGSLLDTALYLTLFVKVASGPTVLWKNFSEQIPERRVTREQFVRGIERLCLGFAKKLILADSFGAVVSGMPGSVDVPTAWISCFMYMLQIYYDFAGYSDIAIGLGRMLGFDFEENFDFPYIACSITEFWRRWHRSLGSFLREYLYIPLGGNRKGLARTLLNIGIVFLVSGIWHGAGWGYLAWGALHGLCQIMERILRDTKFYQKTPKALKYLVTMFVVMIGWEFFRFGNFADTVAFFKVMLGRTEFHQIMFTWQYYVTPRTVTLMVTAVVGATVLAAKPVQGFFAMTQNHKYWFCVRELVLLALLCLSVVFMINSGYSPFIYFRY